MEELAERVHGDIRMALNHLQYMSLSQSVVKYDDIRLRLNSSAKDEDISPFTAVDKYNPFFSILDCHSMELFSILLSVFLWLIHVYWVIYLWCNNKILSNLESVKYDQSFLIT